MVRRGLLKEDDKDKIHLQQYLLGVNVYPSYFSSIIRNEVEILGIDRRYESAVDAIGRVPASEQLEIKANPTYTIVGNIPIVVRESLLPEMMRMGDSVHETARKLAPLKTLAKFYQKEMVRSVDTLVGMIEPIMIVVLGLGVGILIASILVPIYNMTAAF
jgi:5-formaminoimidazole-4-carboxamide-1-(beta)-D-ribofuranosyl 5'-monophosphate synthetase